MKERFAYATQRVQRLKGMSMTNELSPRKTRFRSLLWAVPLFLIGLLLGWLVLGWAVAPVQWINATPPELSRAYQKVYVTLVAREYIQTSDVALAQARLEGWDETDLMNLLALLKQEAAATDALAFDNLRQALALPDANVTLLDTIMEQKAIVIGTVAAAFLLLIAFIMALAPSLQQAQAQRRAEAAQQAMFAAANQPQAPDSAPETVPGTGQNPEQPSDAAASNGAQPQTPTQAPPAPTEDAAADGAGGTVASGAGGAVPPRPQAGQSAAVPGLTPPPPLAEAQLIPQEEQSSVDEIKNSIQNILNSVFDEDESLAHYEALLKGLGEVDAFGLHIMAEKTSRQLRQFNQSQGKYAVATEHAAAQSV